MTNRSGGASQKIDARTLKYILTLSAGLCSAFLLGWLVWASSLSIDTVKLNPSTLTVAPDPNLPPEVQAQERQTVTLLADRDTTSEYTAFGPSQITASFATPQSISAIKIFGPAPYRMNVQALQGGGWVPVPGLQSLDLTALSPAWHVFAASSAVTASSLRFDLVLAGGGGSGLKELEIWGTGPRVMAKDGAQLDTLLQGTQPPANAQSFSASPANGTIDSRGQTVTVQIAGPLYTVKRAWLAYELTGLTHWVSVVRSINGNPVQGGAFVFAGVAGQRQVEPIHPAWLVSGRNTITFTRPKDYTGSYTVQNVRVLVERENGSNFIDSVQGTPTFDGNDVQSAVDGDPTHGWRPYPSAGSVQSNQPQLELYFDKPTQTESLLLSVINKLRGNIKIEFLNAGTWGSASLPTLNAAKLTTGWNEIDLPSGQPVDGVRLDFLNGQGSTGEIGEAAVVGSGMGRSFAPRIVVTYPDAGQYVGRSAYISGFMELLNNGSGAPQVFVAGKDATLPNGAFGLTVTKEDAGFASQASSEPWQVGVDAVYPDGERISTVVLLNQQLSPTGASVTGTGQNGGQQVLKLPGATVIVPSLLAAEAEGIQVEELSEDQLPPLDPGMTNVTRGPRRGYRFKPNHKKFKAPIALIMPYDSRLIPAGMKATDVRTYFYDESLGHWVPLERKAVDSKEETVTSLTTHFTDMINATLSLPDHPQQVSFNPTSIKDIKAADPGAGINLIDPPQANAMGDARLSYPIEVPPGRGGVQPKLSIQYSSSGGNGWLGLGWDLSIPSVGIETRWGVPRYLRDKESETYLLSGEQLTPLAHRSAFVDRVGPMREFHTRVEGQFRKIIRHGTSPANYWWEVTDKNGVKQFFGGTPETGFDAAAVLRGGKAVGANGTDNAVFRWMLVEQRDPNGNAVRYSYAKTGMLPCTDSACELYPASVEYTAHSKAPGPYTVTFVRDSELPASGRFNRKDHTLDARAGFQVLTGDLLRRIDVKFNGQLVRSYALTYQTGEFDKTLLDAIAQYGEQGDQGPVFSRHTFAYYDEVPRSTDGYDAFTSPGSWDTGDDHVGVSFVGGDLLSGVLDPLFNSVGIDVNAATALGTTSGLGGSADSFFGFALIPSKEVSIGKRVGRSRNDSKTLTALMDVNGDGLPDKVFNCGSGCFRYRPNTWRPQLDPPPATEDTEDTPHAAGLSFGVPHDLKSLSAISKQKTVSSFSSTETYFGGAVIFSNTKSQTRETAFMTDVNGDGIPDSVSGSSVRFGVRNPDGSISFAASSTATPAPVGGDTGGASVASGAVRSYNADLAEAVGNSPLLDAVRRWTAPFDGTVDISGDATLVPAPVTDEPDRRDGLRVSVEKNNERLGPSRVLAPGGANTAAMNLQGIPVHKGEAIYFRAQSRYDGFGDKVRWDPKITYQVSDPNATDVNGLRPFTYQASQDFVLTGQIVPADLPFTGTVKLLGTLHKEGATTDDVALSVYHLTPADAEPVVDANGDPVLDPSTRQPLHAIDFQRVQIKHRPTVQYRFAAAAHDVDIDLATALGEIPVSAHDSLVVVVESDSSVNQHQVAWESPQIVYTSAKSNAFDTSKLPPDAHVDGTAHDLQTLDKDGHYLITVPPYYDADSYSESTLTGLATPFQASGYGMVLFQPEIEPTQSDPGGLNEDGQTVPPSYAFANQTESVATAKRPGELVAKRFGRYAKGVAPFLAQQSFALPMDKGEQVYLGISTRDAYWQDSFDTPAFKARVLHPYQSQHVLVPVIQTPDPDQETKLNLNTDLSTLLTVLPRIGLAADATSGADVVLQLEATVYTGDIIDSTTGGVGTPGGETRLVLDQRVIHLRPGEAADPYLNAVEAHVDAERLHSILPGDTSAGRIMALYFAYVVPAAVSGKIEQPAVDVLYSRSEQPVLTQERSELTVVDSREPSPVSGSDPTETVLHLAPQGLPAGADLPITVAPVLRFGDSNASTVSGALTLSIKRRFLVQPPTPPGGTKPPPVVQEQRLATRTFTLQVGEAFRPVMNLVGVVAKAGDDLVLEYSSNDDAVLAAQLNAGLWVQARVVTDTNAWHPVPFAFESRARSSVFPRPYRGWSYIGYKGYESCEQRVALGDADGNPPCADAPIDPTHFGDSDQSLTTPSAVSDALSNSDFDHADDPKYAGALGDPRLKVPAWVTKDDNWRIGPDTFEPSRDGRDIMDFPDSKRMASGTSGSWGAVGVERLTESNESGKSVGFGISLSAPDSDAWTSLDFRDMNGDRYPDVVSEAAGIQYTLPTGQLNSAREGAGLRVSQTHTSGHVLATAGTAPDLNEIADAVKAAQSPHSHKQLEGDQSKSNSQSPPFGFSGGYSDGDAEQTLMDVNGDGLPDVVSQNNGALSVRLNLGYSFAQAVAWQGPAAVTLSSTSTDNFGVSVPGAFNDLVRGFSGGISLSAAMSGTSNLMADVNGDGLPDAVRTDLKGLSVAFNTGTGFTGFMHWGTAGMPNVGLNIGQGAGGSFVTPSLPFCPTPIVPLICYFLVNPSISANIGISRTESTFQDVNGDGFADFVTSHRDSNLSVRLSRIGRTNLLRQVTRPLGATIDLDYQRTGNTYDQPQSRWVLSRVSVFDGIQGDTPSTVADEGADWQVTDYAYADGHYDRDERDFLGFARVSETRLDTRGKASLAAAQAAPAYTRSTRVYLNDSVYTKNLLAAECYEDVQGAGTGPVACKADSTTPPGPGRPFTKTVNSYALVDIGTGQPVTPDVLRTATVFPELTRTQRFFYEGNAGTVKATEMDFTYDALGNVATLLDVGEPGEPADDAYATFAYTECDGSYIVGKPTRMEVFNGSGGALIRKREGDYDCTTGNLERLRQYFTADDAAQTDFAYDDYGNVYTVTGPANARGQHFGLTFDYDPETHSHVTKITDSFQYVSTASYDLRFGRPETQTDLNGNRIRNAYDAFGRLTGVWGPYEPDGGPPTLAFTYHPDDPQPWALTRHLQRDADFAVQADTLDTVLVTDGLKRVLQTKKDARVAGKDVMIVSGRIALDEAGRTVRQFYPTIEPKGDNGGLDRAVDSVAPTVTDFDALDRETRIRIPDGSTTRMTYAIAGNRFLTTTTDAEGNQRRTYRDVRELIRRVEEAEDVHTEYSYDALRQITRVVDTKGNTTAIAYDLLGRRTAIDNPDAGRTETVYDPAGNAVARITANLRAAGKQVTFDYDYNRLAAIHYPLFPGNDVTYAYGAAGDAAARANNQLGRIVKVTHQAGTTERSYDKLGNVASETRSFPDATGAKPHVYTTRFVFDTFGRMLKLTYPDGEVPRNGYDSGGNLARITGTANGRSYAYLQSLAYDKFEQRTHMVYGNGVATDYSYRPDNRRLAHLVSAHGQDTFQNLSYGYDRVGNITALDNDVAYPPTSGFGGPVQQTFGYDGLYRLTQAEGRFEPKQGLVNHYTLAMAYDTIHDIVS
ncbi:MAG TPA: SpvB/TcaC N-terminal domain-containing protein, partial [bacterium]|nr:SpvB/TcaC N-terminal domain-containing protein [bacterium]